MERKIYFKGIRSNSCPNKRKSRGQVTGSKKEKSRGISSRITPGTSGALKTNDREGAGISK